MCAKLLLKKSSLCVVLKSEQLSIYVQVSKLFGSIKSNQLQQGTKLKYVPVLLRRQDHIDPTICAQLAKAGNYPGESNMTLSLAQLVRAWC